MPKLYDCQARFCSSKRRMISNLAAHEAVATSLYAVTWKIACRPRASHNRGDTFIHVTPNTPWTTEHSHATRRKGAQAHGCFIRSNDAKLSVSATVIRHAFYNAPKVHS